MAFGKTASCVVLMVAAVASAAQFPVRHEHLQDHCDGVLTIDDQGVSYAHIIDGRVQHSLLIELLTDHGVGTMVRKEKSW